MVVGLAQAGEEQAKQTTAEPVDLTCTGTGTSTGTGTCQRHQHRRSCTVTALCVHGMGPSLLPQPLTRALSLSLCGPAGPALLNMTMPENSMGYGSPAQRYPLNFNVNTDEPVQMRLLRPKLLLAYGQVRCAALRYTGFVQSIDMI